MCAPCRHQVDPHLQSSLPSSAHLDAQEPRSVVFFRNSFFFPFVCPSFSASATKRIKKGWRCSADPSQRNRGRRAVDFWPPRVHEVISQKKRRGQRRTAVALRREKIKQFKKKGRSGCHCCCAPHAKKAGRACGRGAETGQTSDRVFFPFLFNRSTSPPMKIISIK